MTVNRKKRVSIFDRDYWLDLGQLFDKCEKRRLTDGEAVQLGIMMNSIPDDEDPDVVMGLIIQLFEGKYGYDNASRVTDICYRRIDQLIESGMFPDEFVEEYFYDCDNEEGLCEDCQEKITEEIDKKDYKELN